MKIDIFARLAVLAAAALASAQAGAAGYRSQTSGSWTDSIWENTTRYPNGTDDGATIKSGHVVDISAADIIVKNLTINSGGTLNVTGGSLGSAAGGYNYKVESGGFFDHSGGTVAFTNVNSSATYFTLNAPSLDSVCYRLRGTARFNARANVDSGTFEVNGGSINVNTRFRVPSNSNKMGRLLFKDVAGIQDFRQLELAAASSATGHLSVVDSKVALTNANVNWSYPVADSTGSRAVIRIDNSRMWLAGGTSSNPSLMLGVSGGSSAGTSTELYVMNGSTLLVGGAFNQSGFDNDTVWNAFATAKLNYNDLYIRNGATVVVDGTSTLKVKRQIFGAPGGRLVIDGGTVECWYFGTEDQKSVVYTTPYRVDMKGGTLTSTSTDSGVGMMIGGDAYKSDYRANMCPVVFTQTGGVVSNAMLSIKIASGSTNSVGRYVFAGGSIAAGTKITVASGFGELVFRGSAFDGRLTHNEGIGNAGGLVEFTLDKSPSHITNVYFSGQKAYAGGHLRVALDGGVLLTEPTEFLLIEKKSGTGRDLTNNGSTNFASTPDGTLWTTALGSGNLKVTATMAAALGTVPANGETFAPESPSAVGSVQLTQLQVGQKLTVSMRVRDADGHEMSQDALDSLVAGLAAAGYTNSTADASASYNLTAVLPGDCVTATSERFAWDFTVNSVRDIATNGTTRVLAKVAGLKADTGKKGLVIYFH